MLEKIFKDENEMYVYLRDEVVAKQKLSTCYVNEIKMEELANCPILASSFASEYDVSEETITECMDTGVCTVLPFDGVEKTMPTYPTALMSLSERAGLHGRTISHHPIELNGGFKYYPDECQPLTQNGALLAVHSNEYAYLRQDQLMQTAMLGLEEAMGVCEFVEGTYSPWITTIRWRFPEAKFERLGIKATPALLLTTNDVAKCGANLHATMEIENHSGGAKTVVSCRMGQMLSCTHKDKHTISDFKANIDQVFSLLKKSEEKLEELKKIKIKHPEECFINIIRQYNLPKAAGESALDDFTTFRGSEVSAFDIYIYLWNIKVYLKDASPSKICDTEEMIARVANLSPATWTKLDSII